MATDSAFLGSTEEAEADAEAEAAEEEEEEEEVEEGEDEVRARVGFRRGSGVSRNGGTVGGGAEAAEEVEEAQEREADEAGSAAVMEGKSDRAVDGGDGVRVAASPGPGPNGGSGVGLTSIAHARSTAAVALYRTPHVRNAKGKPSSLLSAQQPSSSSMRERQVVMGLAFPQIAQHPVLNVERVQAGRIRCTRVV